MTDERSRSVGADDFKRNVDWTRAKTEVRDGRTLVGYAAVFNQEAEIEDWAGEYKEIIRPQAFNKSIKEKSGSIRTLFNHGMDPNIGLKPLGKPSVIRSDAYGLYVEVPLAKTSYNDDILELVRAGALDGMSIQGRVLEVEWNKDKTKRWVNQVELLELGPVTYQAYAGTTLAARSKASSSDRSASEADRLPDRSDQDELLARFTRMEELWDKSP